MQLETSIKVSLLHIQLGHQCIDLACTHAVFTLQRLAELETLVQEVMGLLDLASFQVALSQLCQDVDMVVSGFVHLAEDAGVDFKCAEEVVYGHVVVLDLEVCFTKVGVGDY